MSQRWGQITPPRQDTHDHTGGATSSRPAWGQARLSQPPRPFRTTTEPDPHAPDSVDLVRRDFTAERPGIKVVGDITYIRTWQGWLYLASLIDGCTREVIGYAMADHLRTELVLNAVDMAMRNRRLDADCIMHPTAAPNIRRVNTGRNWSSVGCGIRSGGPVNVGTMRSRNRFSRA